MLSTTECAERRRPAAMPSLYIRVGAKYELLPENLVIGKTVTSFAKCRLLRP
jgi:hypothetical protein